MIICLKIIYTSNQNMIWCLLKHSTNPLRFSINVENTDKLFYPAIVVIAIAFHLNKMPLCDHSIQLNHSPSTILTHFFPMLNCTLGTFTTQNKHSNSRQPFIFSKMKILLMWCLCLHTSEHNDTPSQSSKLYSLHIVHVHRKVHWKQDAKIYIISFLIVPLLQATIRFYDFMSCL